MKATRLPLHPSPSLLDATAHSRLAATPPRLDLIFPVTFHYAASDSQQGRILRGCLWPSSISHPGSMGTQIDRPRQVERPIWLLENQHLRHRANNSVPGPLTHRWLVPLLDRQVALSLATPSANRPWNCHQAPISRSGVVSRFARLYFAGIGATSVLDC